MNILFMTLLDFDNIEEHNIYTDLLRKFYQEGHAVYIISPVERKRNVNTNCIRFDDRLSILKLKIGNIQKTNLIEKGITTILLEQKFIAGIKKYFSDITFHLVLYSTPPITLQKAVAYVKKRDHAVTYLMLKDIFPQNALDLGMLSRRGIKGILYRYFRRKEKKLYQNSDYIGCMSQANVDYVLRHNSYIEPEKVEVCPNCIEVSENIAAMSQAELEAVGRKYGIPNDKTIFVYGGNLGKPQGADFIAECIRAAEALDHIFILIVGSGTEYGRLDAVIRENNLRNTKLIEFLPKKEYDLLLNLCDVGLLFLDYRFTIPNFPSRILSYMNAQKPVLAIVDEATDIGDVIKEGRFGWVCKSNHVKEVMKTMEGIRKCSGIEQMGENGKAYLKTHYNVGLVYNVLVRHVQDR